jgi:catechol-2,3-dioxygenase
MTNMSPLLPVLPAFAGFDHIHIFVSNRANAEQWYARVLGLMRTPQLEFWATGGGPLTLQDPTGAVHLALFERPPQPCRSTVALRVGGPEFERWQAHLEQVLPGQVTLEDHTVALSLYFADPDGNPYEITTYERAP